MTSPVVVRHMVLEGDINGAEASEGQSESVFQRTAILEALLDPK